MNRRIAFMNTKGGLTLRNPARVFDEESRDQQIERVRLQVLANHDGKAVGPPHVVSLDDIPDAQESNRDFRNALKIVGTSVAPDMPKARQIHMAKIREARDEKLADLDVVSLKAIEEKDVPAQGKAAADKQKLRDLPATFDLTGASTTAELKALWPPELT